MFTLSVTNYYVICIIFSVIPVLIKGQHASYGEACNDDLPCDSLKFEKCDKGVCSCTAPSIMYFDEQKGRCALKANETCFYRLPTMTKPDTELGCGSNSRCTFNEEQEMLRDPPENFTRLAWCKCDPDFVLNLKNGGCISKGDHGASCDRDNLCREDLHLICDQNLNTCECNNLTRYRADYQLCAGQVGASCKDHSICVPNSNCLQNWNWKNPSMTTDEDGENSSFAYENATCECQDGYIATSQGFCQVGFNQFCDHSDASKRCVPGFVCRDNVCACEHFYHQLFISNRCTTLVGGPCSIFSPDSCIAHAHCVTTQDEGSTQGTCQCKPGFVEVDRACAVGFGGKCGQYEANMNLPVRCDTVAGLHCIDATCQCDSLEYLDKQTKSCIGLVGALCFTTISQMCTPGAFCEEFRNGQETNQGRCACQAGYVRTSDGKCAFEGGSRDTTVYSRAT